MQAIGRYPSSGREHARSCKEKFEGERFRFAEPQPSKTAGDARISRTIRKSQSKFRENLQPAQMVPPAKMTIWLIDAATSFDAARRRRIGKEPMIRFSFGFPARMRGRIRFGESNAAQSCK